MLTVIWIIIIWFVAGLLTAILVGRHFKAQQSDEEPEKLTPAEINFQIREREEREKERVRQRELF